MIIMMIFSMLIWIMKKMGILQLKFFWVVKDICNSLYLYIMSANGQVAWITIQHMYNAIYYNSIKTIHFQLLCNYIITAPMMSYWHH